MCKNNPKKGTESSRSGYCIAFAFVIVVSLWGLSWWGISNFIEEPTNQGTFGDMFGAVNALFSGLAFAGLIATLLYQKNELKLQREELKLTREELQSQRKEFEEQNKTMKRQRFENTFFNMLSLQQEIVANLSYENPHKGTAFTRASIYQKKEVFNGIYTDAMIVYKGNLCYGGIKDKLRDRYTEYSSIQELSFLDHYFRHLYRIYKYVDSSDLIADEERYNYACIIRSQLSDYELIMLFYNCLTENGREKFKPLIEKYTTFNNLRDELLADVKHKNEYAETAYNRIQE